MVNRNFIEIMLYLPVLILSVFAIISGTKFENGNIPVQEKRRYLREGSAYTPGQYHGTGNGAVFWKGRETHLPIGVGGLIMFLCFVIEILISDNPGKGFMSAIGCIFAIIGFGIAAYRAISKHALAPVWARPKLKRYARN